MLLTMFSNLVNKFVNTQTSKMVIMIRTDISMGKGKIASQAAHAAVTLYNTSLQNKNPYLQQWLDAGQPKVVVKVDKDCIDILNKAYQEALNNGLVACKIYDAGKTQVNRGTLTAVGIGPHKGDDVDRITKDFKLL